MRREKLDRGAAGQAAVELALALPVVVLLLLAVAQVVVVAREQLLVVHAAREAARQAAVDPSPAAARQAAAAGSGLDARRLHVDVRNRAGPGSRLHVTVRFGPPTQVPIVGAVVADLTLRAGAAMRTER